MNGIDLEIAELQRGLVYLHTPKGSQIVSRRKLEEQLDRLLAAWHFDGRLKLKGIKCQLGELVKRANRENAVHDEPFIPQYPSETLEQLESAIMQFEPADRRIIALEAPPKAHRDRDRVRAWAREFRAIPNSQATYYRRLKDIRETLIIKMMTW